METETLVLNLGSQAAAALMVLTAARCDRFVPARTQASARPDIERSASGQLWSTMKMRWLQASDREG